MKLQLYRADTWSWKLKMKIIPQNEEIEISNKLNLGNDYINLISGSIILMNYTSRERAIISLSTEADFPIWNFDSKFNTTFGMTATLSLIAEILVNYEQILKFNGTLSSDKNLIEIHLGSEIVDLLNGNFKIEKYTNKNNITDYIIEGNLGAEKTPSADEFESLIDDGESQPPAKLLQEAKFTIKWKPSNKSLSLYIFIDSPLLKSLQISGEDSGIITIGITFFIFKEFRKVKTSKINSFYFSHTI